jgi:mono/diheme cytochrome c family protein
VAQGHLLFTKRGCWGCHGLVDVSLGERGPDLSDVGRRLNGEEIYLAIENPSAAPSSTTMPRFRLAEEERQDLVTFLLAQIDRQRQDALTTSHLIATRRPGSPPPRPPVDPGMAQGAAIMADMGCTACHRLEMYDGQVGPDLRWEGRLRGPQFVDDMIQLPAGAVHNSRMPPFDLTKSEVEAVKAYLARQLARAPHDGEESWRTVCARCHGLDGRGRTAVAPYLARRPRDLSEENFFKQVPVQRLVRAMTHGVAGTPMAPWGRAVPLKGMAVVILLSDTLHQGGMPQKGRNPVVAPRKEATAEAEEAAEKVFAVECAQCHGPTGLGDGPEATGLRHPPRDLSNSLFIANLDDRRLYSSIAHGPPGEVMPGHLWGHTAPIVWALVDKVRAIAGDPLVGPHNDDEWPWQKTDRLRRRIRARKGTATKQPSPPQEPNTSPEQPGQQQRPANDKAPSPQ